MRLLLLLTLAGCATVPSALPTGPTPAQIAVAERAWHTDLCVTADQEAGDPLAALAADFPGARFLCFGFGERQYLLTAEPGFLEALSALLPSRAAVLMTALSAPPAAAFGPDKVIDLRVTEAGERALRAYLWRSLQIDATGKPAWLRDGFYPGSVFYAASRTYDIFNTCNTWTADGLRAAGFPVRGPVIFAGPLMSQLRQIAAAQGQ